MTTGYKKIVSAALHMPYQGRAKLAEKLLRSLEEPKQAEIEKMWAQEAEKRLQETKQGKVKLVDGEKALKRLKARYS